MKRPPRSKARRKKKDLRHLIELPGVERFRPYLTSLMEEGDYVVFDIETTGGNPEKNGLTEFCGLKFEKGKITDSFNTLINPKIPIPPIVRKMTGINDRMVRNAPTIEESMPKILDFIGDRVVVSHNTIGDLKFLRYFAKKVCGKEFDNFFICTHLLSELYLALSPDKSLKGLAKFLEFEFEGAHRAEADAQFTLQLFKTLVNLALQDGLSTVEHLIRKQGDYESSFRLGWGVPSRELTQLPPTHGLLKCYDLKQRILYCVSSANLREEGCFLQKYGELPRPMLRKIFGTYHIECVEAPHHIAALRLESQVNKQHGLQPVGEYLNQRRLAAYYLLRESNGQYSLNVGHPVKESVYVLGPVFDRKQALYEMKNLGDHLGLTMLRHKLCFDEPLALAIYASLSGGLVECRASIQKELSGWRALINWRKRKSLRETLRWLDVLEQYRTASAYCDLLNLQGQLQVLLSGKNIVLDIVQSQIQRETSLDTDFHQEPSPRISPEDLRWQDIGTIQKRIRDGSGEGIYEFEVWEYLVWLIFSNRGRKLSRFALKK